MESFKPPNLTNEPLARPTNIANRVNFANGITFVNNIQAQTLQVIIFEETRFPDGSSSQKTICFVPTSQPEYVSSPETTLRSWDQREKHPEKNFFQVNKLLKLVSAGALTAFVPWAVKQLGKKIWELIQHNIE